MTKLTYTNDKQFINDAAQMILENHLSWSGSLEGLPSRDLGGVRGKVIDAYLEGNYTEDEWDEKSEESKKLAKMIASSFYGDAAQIADKKWVAAMTLLGF